MARTIPLPPVRRGPDGERLCRWCGKPVPCGRREWCSAECVHQFQLRAWPDYWAKQVYRRDQGVCRDCGLRVGDLVLAIGELGRGANQYEFLQQNGLWGRRRLWEAHHVVAVKDGGESTLENGITLCRRCHRARHASKSKSVEV